MRGYVERMRFAINEEFAVDSDVVREGDEVDVLPPVAGGSATPQIEVTDAPLSLDKAFNAVAHAGAGAVVLFTGTVRDNVEGKPVARLDYEAHVTLAVKDMRRIATDVTKRRSDVRVAAFHRVGQLQIGDLAVVVAASAPHRAQAFQAAREVIDLIKETVPIWKKEWDAEGQAVWVNLES